MTEQFSSHPGAAHRMDAPAHPSRRPADNLAWVSWLRVAAIAAVVLIHAAGITAVAPDARETAQGQLAIALDFFARWSVPVFVMLSGAMLLDPDRFRGSRDFFRKRALRLVPAVVVWHLAYTIFILVIEDRDLTFSHWLQLVMTGRLRTALYFFWIVLGLAVVTPVLVPWIAATTRRAQVTAGLVAASVPALMVVTVPIRTDILWKPDMSWVETPWTWWIPYVGYFILGYALRDVVLTGWRLALAAVGAVGGSALLTWQWGRDTGVGGLLERFVPAEAYYSPTLIVVALSVFLLARATIQPRGLLRGLSRPTPARVGRGLGDATLGVFAVHLLVLEAVLASPVIGGEKAAGSVAELLARCVVVFVVSYVISLVARRVPVVRRVF